MISEDLLPVLDHIVTLRPWMEELVTKWALIPSGSDDQEGLEKMLSCLNKAFSPLGDSSQDVRLQQTSSKALHVRKRTDAALKIFFGGHMDTVFGKAHPFKKVTKLSSDSLQGPGVADMKGGLVIALAVLTILEESSWGDEIGWDLFISPDEEIGSLYSAPYLESIAKECHLGLVFEPTLPSGSFVSRRKGSVNFLLTAHGTAAHAGREPEKGDNAIVALSHLIAYIDKNLPRFEDMTLNFGVISGGHGTNMIPDQAHCHFNIRAFSAEKIAKTTENIQKTADLLSKQMGDKISFTFEKLSSRPPKPLDSQTETLMNILNLAGAELAFPITWEETGGVSDGNLLASYGLPTIDTCGVKGGNLHTTKEYLELDSLVEKTELITLFLYKLIREK